MVIRKAPEKPRPKPAPATVVPARKAADVVVAIAPNVTAAPVSKSRQPASIAARELMARSANAAAVPVPLRTAHPAFSLTVPGWSGIPGSVR